MKAVYFLISSFAVASTIVGVAIATVNQPLPVTLPLPTATAPTPDRLASATLEATQPAPTPQPEPLSSQSLLTVDGVGSVRVGMTLTQAEQATGMSIPAPTVGENGCGYTQPQGIENLLFMVTDNQISRVDVVRDSPIKTLSGLGIGNTRAEVEAMYPTQIEVWAHKYVQGAYYLIYVPTDVSDRNYRIVFETDENGIVTRLRSGKLPEVTWVEGCS